MSKPFATNRTINEAWYLKARCLALQGELVEAIDSLSRAIELYPECREWAKTNADFDGIRGEDWFQTLVEEIVEE